jgi:hypothetical protein
VKTRTCPRCKEEHTRSHNYCLPCHRAYNREWRERSGPRKGQPPNRAWSPNPAQKSAYNAVYEAIKRKDLVRPDKCSSCQRSCRPQAHHDDYGKPLDVQWLCQRCHKRLHYQVGDAA